MSAPGPAAVAAWDTPLLDGAVVTLGAVAGRLPSWRGRVEEVARQLAGAECWSGPAASVAATALGEVSAVVTAVTDALGSSLCRLEDTAREARTAQELAGQALAAAAASGTALDAAGTVVPPAPLPPPADATPGQLEDHYAGLAEQAAAAERVADLAADAMGAAARAALAAAASGDPLAAVGGTGGGRPAGFAGLAGIVGAAAGSASPPAFPPPSATPDEVASWWAGLSGPARDELLEAVPTVLGGLDGLPAWARDQANRELLDRALTDSRSGGWATARAVAEEIAAEEAAGRTVQLWSFDADDHLAALAYGDVDPADHVAVLVPGVGNDVDDLDDMGDDARSVADAARAAAPGAAVAAIAWLGYRPPASVASAQALGEGRAATGGRALAGDLAGLRAARAADPVHGATPLRTTVVAHSYGTVVVDLAAEEPGDLDADALVLLGSPGMDGPASDLEADDVFEASSLVDPITHALGVHGGRTGDWDFGATSLPTDWTTGHTEYLDEDRPTLAAVGDVVGGTREAG